MSKITDLDSLMPLIREQLAVGGSVTFSPRGISMLPMLRQGKDTVTLSPITGVLKKYDLPLYQRDDGQYVLHRIISVGDTYKCIGDNQLWVESGIRREQMIAVVSTFNRGGKDISVKSFSYKLYCRIWNFLRFFRRLWHRGKSLIKRLINK